VIFTCNINGEGKGIELCRSSARTEKRPVHKSAVVNHEGSDHIPVEHGAISRNLYQVWPVDRTGPNPES
jgi:hypothetical protein